MSSSDSMTQVAGPGDVPKDPDLEAVEKHAFTALSSLSSSFKSLLLFIFCLAFFIDAFNNSALFTAIPIMAVDLNLPDSESVWILVAYQIAFAALLLVSGRAVDLYNPKWMFVCGATIITIFSLVDGWIRSSIPLLVLRGLMGVGAAAMIPSAQGLIVHMYPDPREQAVGLSLYGAGGALGNVLGVIVGAAFVQYVSWHWIFWFSAILTGVIALAVLVLVPNPKPIHRQSHWVRFKRLDLIGLSFFTLGAILFIFAVTSGAIAGWGSARVIAPLVISILLFVCFGFWEAWLPPYYAALPSRVWRYENFAVLFIITFAPFAWVASCFLLFAWYWELVYDWSPMKTGVRLLALGLIIFPVLPIAVYLQTKMRLKWILVMGMCFLTGGTILLPFANSPERYARFALSGFIVGSVGMSLLCININIAMLAVTPAEMAGVVSALYNCALQAGSGLGTGIATSIQTSVQTGHGGPDGFEGRAAGLWFLVAFLATITLVFLVFCRDTMGPVDPNAPHGHAPPPPPAVAGTDSKHNADGDAEKAAGGSPDALEVPEGA